MTSFIKDTIADAKDSVLDSIFYAVEENLGEEFKTIKDKTSSPTEKSRASKRIYNAILNESDGIYVNDYVFETLDGALIYYSDQDKVIAEYGLNNAIGLYQDEFGSDLPKENPAGALAFVVLENEFFNTYSRMDLAKEFMREYGYKNKSMKGKRVRAWRKNPKNPITKSMFRKLVFGARKRSGRITVKKTVGKKPVKVSTRRMVYGRRN